MQPRRRPSRPLLRHGLTLLAVAGAVLALWPLGQTAYGRWQQKSLRAAWDAASAYPPAPSAPAPVVASTPASPPGTSTPGASPRGASPVSAPPAPARQVATRFPDWPNTRLVIPDIALDVVVVQGMDAVSLRRGPGHAVQSALPGQPGNCVIAGHRNVYGSWFYRFDELLPGSLIELHTLRHTYTYRMTGTRNISDADTTFLRPPDNPAEARLTLITCTLPHTAARFVIESTLIASR